MTCLNVQLTYCLNHLDTPIAESGDYRLEVLIALRNLERLDKDQFIEEERAEADEIIEQRRQKEEEEAAGGNEGDENDATINDDDNQASKADNDD